MTKLSDDVISQLIALENPAKINIFKRFFKTGPGQYGENDEFFGLTVPQIHQIEAKYWKQADLDDVATLLNHPTHECRTVAVMFLVRMFQKSPPLLQKQISSFYLAHTARINNWDLVDISAPKIIGAYLLDKPRSILFKLAKSTLIWDRRISIISTFTFIRQNDFNATMNISELLLADKHDLIHKAVGWMLREVGKRNQKVLTDFLDLHAARMPRTALRYAIEKLPETSRRHYLALKYNQ